MAEMTTDIGWWRVDPQEAHQRNLICAQCLRQGRGPQRAEFEQEQTALSLCFLCLRETSREQNPERHGSACAAAGGQRARM
jgi:hypothetical protein